MTEGCRDSWLCRTDRLGNDELCALMAKVAKHGPRASQQLLATVKPLLSAFYEGQVQAGRARREEVDGLIQEAFMALQQRRADYDPGVPFRAWLIAIARETLLYRWQNQGRDAGVAAPLNEAGRAV
jgi:RNA polymerase sigma-70 factor (ECF subfamily)